MNHPTRPPRPAGPPADEAGADLGSRLLQRIGCRPLKKQPVWRFTGASAGVAGALVALVALGGCASVPPPHEAMAVAAASVSRAINAATAAQAPAELRLAVDKLAAARAALAAGRDVEAQRLAEQADLDAQVAEMEAQRVRATLAAQESEAAARAMREELQRKTGR